MNSCKNLNDIPIQFRQYENTKNYCKEENISQNKKHTEKKIKEIKSENFQVQPQINQNSLNLKDRIFIFLIIAIFFDVLWIFYKIGCCKQHPIL